MQTNEKTTNQSSGFEIKPEQRQSWLSLTMIWVGSMICVPCLMVGSFLGSGFNFGMVALCILVGYGIVCAYMCFMGMQSCDTGLPTVSMASGPLGTKGAQYIISLLLAVACVGWFGIQSAVCGSSFSAMILGMTGIDIPVWLSSTVWGALMLLTAMYGYKALKYLNYIAVPALVLVLIYGVWAAITQNDGVNVLTNYVPATQMTFVMGISLTVATFALGGVISGDYSRYAKSRGDVIKSSLIGVLPAGFAMMMVGAVLSIITGQFDISAVLSAVGVPAFGLVALVLATWTTNVVNAYSGGIAFSNLFGLGEKQFKITTGIAGAVGTILAAVGLMSQFESFLGILTAFIPPVAGVIMADYWILGKGKKENFKIANGFRWTGILSFVLGAAVAYVTGNVPSMIFFVGPVNGIVVSMVVYILIARFEVKK